MSFLSEQATRILKAKFHLYLYRKKIVYFFRKYYLKLLIKINVKPKIILGAALTSQFGWVSTNEEWLDITSEYDWLEIFKGKRIVKNMVAEHVFEHLTESEAKKALLILKKYLVHGGKIRIAVPDGNNPDPEYRRNAGINGLGPDASDHKQFYTAENLIDLLNSSGFDAILVEGFTKEGSLVIDNCLKEEGFIRRSRSNQALDKTKYGWNFKDANTSLIVDGILKE